MMRINPINTSLNHLCIMVRITFVFLLLNSSLLAQIPVTVSGTAVTSPVLAGSYSSLANALTALNAVTSYTTPGTIFFTCTGGNSETAPPTGLVIGSTSINPLLSAINTVTINKSGGTVTIDPGIGTATPTSAAPDGIISIRGADYITIDGLTLSAGTNNFGIQTLMEYGIGLFKLNSSDGAQNNTIQNCTINIHKDNNAAGTAPMIDGSVGILMINSTATAATTALIPTTAAGANSNNKFYSNIVDGGNYGIGLIGFAGASPFNACDFNNDIGGISLSTGNSIRNFGLNSPSTTSSSGIRTWAQYSINVSYNTVNNDVGGTYSSNHPIYRGIFLDSATSANATINNNTVTMKSNSPTLILIDNLSGSTAASNTISISNNTLMGGWSGGSQIWTGINNQGTADSVYINGNTMTGFNLNSAGTYVMIETGSPITAIANYNIISNIGLIGSGMAQCRVIKTTSPTNFTANGNLIDGVGKFDIGFSPFQAIDGIYSAASSVNVTANNNIIRNLWAIGAGPIRGIFESGASGMKTFQNNQIYNFQGGGGTNSITFIGIFCAAGIADISNNQVYSLISSNYNDSYGPIIGIQIAGGTTHSISKNKICDLSSGANNPFVSGIFLSSGTNVTINNNRISDLRVYNLNGENSLTGINITGSTTVNCFYNTVNLNLTNGGSGLSFGSSALSISTSASLTLKNNIFINTSQQIGSTGYTVAYRRIGSSLSTYSSSSNNNLFYAGIPGPNNLIHYDGTNSFQTISAYKSMVLPAILAPRDANSISENPPFLSSNCGDTNFLKINSAIATAVESGGSNIAGITDDFENEIRQGNSGYSGTGTAPDIGADEFGVVSSNCIGTPASTSITGATAVCNNTGTTLSLSTVYNNSGIIYQWSVASVAGGPYTPLGSSAQQPTGNLTSAKYYKCTITCAFGSSFTTVPYNLTVNSNPNSAITVTGATTFCSGDSVILNATITANRAYQWKKNGTNISGATSSKYTAKTSGTYKVIVTNTNTGCSSTTSTGIVVTANPKPSVAFSANGPTTFCYGGSVTFTATAISSTYQWIINNADIPGATGQTYNVTSTGTYKLRTSNSYGCSNTSTGVFVKVNSLPSSTVTASGPLSFCAGDSVVFTAASGTGFTYQWKRNGTNLAGAINQKYTAKIAGTYKVTVIKSSTGCSIISSGKVVSVPCKNSSNEIENVDFMTIYPNPSAGNFIVEFSETINSGEISIYDVFGKQVYRTILSNSTQAEISLENNSAGIYFVKVIDQSKNYCRKIIIQGEKP